VFDGEFDPGSGLTLAVRITHASRARAHFPQGRWVPSGERVSNTWATFPIAGDNSGKPLLIPHVVTARMTGEQSSNAPWEGPAAAVIGRGRALSRVTGRKARVGVWLGVM